MLLKITQIEELYRFALYARFQNRVFPDSLFQDFHPNSRNKWHKCWRRETSENRVRSSFLFLFRRIFHHLVPMATSSLGIPPLMITVSPKGEWGGRRKLSDGYQE
ncbi:hypothetical protein CDAR_128391 [Caerostris darwini]|uniref:Ycf15 n=1 Tax=Caerostris darwini TaxID=1538125 RepID=A0AAV4PCP4_9ARAC|nr:hypothetical protein CDAR_128391 [Caerostris darwini]